METTNPYSSISLGDKEDFITCRSTSVFSMNLKQLSITITLEMLHLKLMEPFNFFFSLFPHPTFHFVRKKKLNRFKTSSGAI